MITLFEIGPVTNSLSFMDFVTTLGLLLILIWFFKRKVKTSVLIRFGFSVVLIGLVANLAWNSYWHYEKYKSYINGTAKLRVVEGVVEKKIKTEHSEWKLFVDEMEYYYSDRGGVGCQGEEGWLYNNLNEGDYVRLSYLAIYERENDIRCLVKLEKR